MADAKGNTFEGEILGLIFNATSIANLAINASTSPFTSLSVQLHTADPLETGSMVTNEAAYTSYTRIGVARTTVGWIVTNNSVSPGADIVFPQVSGGSTDALTHFSIGTSTVAASTGRIFYAGTITPPITIAVGVQPRLTTATVITEN